MKKTKTLCIFLCLIIASFTFCSRVEEVATVEVESVSISPTTLTLTEGESQSLTASVNPNNADIKGISWSSSNTAVAIVSDGKVTAVSAGSATITAKSDDGGKTATCQVTVNAMLVPVSGVSLDKSSIELTEGDKVKLSVTITPENATNKNVTWSSSDEAVAIISDGEITAIKEGNVVVSASVDNFSAMCSVKVNKKIIDVESITLKTEKKRLKVGETYAISYEVLPAEANNYTISFVSGDESVATINNDGIITAKQTGNTTITVMAENKEVTLTLKVFNSDDVYFGFSRVIGSDYISYLYNNENKKNELSGFLFNDIYFKGEDMIYVGTEEHRIKNSRTTFITNGVSEYPQNQVLNANSYLNASHFDGNHIYTLISGSSRDSYGIWKDLEKKYDDILAPLRLTPYSDYGIADITTIGDDIYACGTISEPVDENTRETYPVIWKNGEIYKKFGPFDVSIFFNKIINANGKLYILANETISLYYEDILSVWDENGKCFDVGNTMYASSGKLYYFDNQLYVACVKYLDRYNFKNSVMTVYEKDKELFTIDNVDSSQFALDYVDGDIYSAIVKKEKKGGNTYYSASLYRGDKEEIQVMSPVMDTLWRCVIKAFRKD